MGMIQSDYISAVILTTVLRIDGVMACSRENSEKTIAIIQMRPEGSFELGGSSIGQAHP